MATSMYRSFYLIVIIILFNSGLAQQPPKSQSKPKKPSSKISSAEPEQLAQQRKLLVLRVYGFTEQLLALRDNKIKIRAIARLGELLWKEDEPYARQLFTKALELCAPKSEATDADRQSIARLRREVIAIIAKRDSNLAKHLIDGVEETQDTDKVASADERMQANFKTAYDLLKSEPDKSIEFAERSLRSGISPDMYSFLILLRLKNESAANALFLKVLDHLVAQPVVTADSLLLIGIYVFTSPTFDPSDQSIAPDTVRLVGVGKLLLSDITGDRPNIPREIVRSYLKAATMILSRQVVDPGQRTQYYAASRLLLPKTVKFTPELTEMMAGVMQRLSPDIPQELTMDSSYVNFKVDAPKELTETIKEIEKEKSAQRRNERYLILIADLWRRADYSGARALTSKISDPEASADLETIINFKEGSDKLGRSELLGEVEATARKLPPGVERTLLWLGISRAYLKAGDVPRAYESLTASTESARKIDDARRPFLTLNIASQFEQLDHLKAQSTLAEAVSQFNAQQPEALAQVSWERRIETGRMWRVFPLEVKGVDRDMKQTLLPLMKGDPEGTIETVRKLTDERQLASALLAVAAAILT
jgi:hypothetical protein